MLMPGTLTAMREPIAGVAVSNAAQASGGEDGESVEQAVARGREAVQALSSAVTARDFERLALAAGGVARARAYAQRELWTFGEPGVVELRIVPLLAAGQPATPETMRAHQTRPLIERVDALIAEYRPIGVRTRVLLGTLPAGGDKLARGGVAGRGARGCARPYPRAGSSVDLAERQLAVRQDAARLGRL